MHKKRITYDLRSKQLIYGLEVMFKWKTWETTHRDPGLTTALDELRLFPQFIAD